MREGGGVIRGGRRSKQKALQWMPCNRTEQLKKLGKIYYYLDLFHHYRSLHTPRVFKPIIVAVGTT
jgi:hypothetical protein